MKKVEMNLNDWLVNPHIERARVVLESEAKTVEEMMVVLAYVESKEECWDDAIEICYGYAAYLERIAFLLHLKESAIGKMIEDFCKENTEEKLNEIKRELAIDNPFNISVEHIPTYEESCKAKEKYVQECRSRGENPGEPDFKSSVEGDCFLIRGMSNMFAIYCHFDNYDIDRDIRVTREKIKIIDKRLEDECGITKDEDIKALCEYCKADSAESEKAVRRYVEGNG